ncbi:tRNA (adenosine(37)-N6)-threonylcarbamoyltransferase complex dimerization subunit type 1 TsaB [Alteromonadales bacterium alter-6D02]|nr:tRNA (adenosine(37)-N6)-threonylcarbamoyltransferase complex dimerization subunit type 1 TsaB [Alteromonadales bacterium alter-6D02]
MSEKILIIDTSTEACSVALLHNDNVISSFDVTPRSHTKMVLPMVDTLLKQAQLKVNDLDAIAWGRGPGSFTGVRIGTGIMQGLALGAEKPVIALSTLATMAQEAIDKHQAEYVMAGIDARMGEVYWGIYRNENGLATLVGEEQVLNPEVLTQLTYPEHSFVAVGTAWQAYPELVKMAKITVLESVLYPNAEAMAPLAKQAWKSHQAVDVEEAAPVYLRDTVTWKKLPGRE